MESREECLIEATECDRLAGLAKTPNTRAIMLALAFKWRRLAEKATDREIAYQRALAEMMSPRC
jgi:hypothetical protein